MNNVSFAYGSQRVLQEFSLQVAPGECVCLFGPSGCGKTTALRLLLGLEQPEQGSVSAPKRMACVFQEDRLLPHLSVLENVCLPLTREERPKGEALLEQMGLGAVKRARPSDLSGGMQRRVALARAIAFGGDALVLDEPFNGIDSENKGILADIIHREYLAKNKSVLLITHTTEDVALLGARMVYMK